MSRRERQRRRNRRRGGSARPIFLTLGVLATVACLAVLGVVGWVISVAASSPSLDALKPIDPGATSVVYAANGARLGFIQSDILRTPVPAADVPQVMRNATVAIEDKRFFEHTGVDFEGIIRAGVKNVTTGETVQGGSTLSMQLVRNLYTDARVRTGIAGYERKIREAKLAEELENEHPGRAGKLWILNAYVNNVPYGTVGGQEAVGIQAAARVFFDKPASKLRLREAALLAGLPQAPTTYNPFLDPRAALQRRNEVLRAMAAQGYIAPTAAQHAMARGLGVRHSRFYTARRENYFFDFVRSELIKRYGVATVRRGGLKIHTTIDLRLQREARAAMANTLNYPDDPASAIVSIDPRTGDIRAMATSERYDQSKFNLAAQGHRQPGSTFKVMVLMTALRRGVDPYATTYVSKPLKFDDPEWGPIDVQTFGNSYRGTINLVQATLASDNSVYQQLDLDVGPVQVKQTARDMGIVSKLNGYPAEGLGGLEYGVSPLEMANAYATIASGGLRNRPIAVTKVRFPDGHVDNLGKPRRTREFEDGVTYEATQILEQNIQAGTGTAAGIGCPAGGKTGTTDDFRDAWFVGFTPRLSTAVWIGYPNAQIPMTSVHGIAVQGGSFPAQIWGAYMSQAKGSFCGDFPPPTQPFQSTPFFGHYATTGAPGDEVATPEETTTTPEDTTTTETTPEQETTTTPPADDTDDEGFDPSEYETPPQPPPETQPPPTTPAPPSTDGGGTAPPPAGAPTG